MNPIQQGLYISVVGIIVLFIVCAIFYFLLVGLQALFPDKSQKEENGEQEIVAPVKVMPSDDNSIVAAIAVALQLAQTQPYEGLGDSLQESRSAWWSSRLISAQNRKRK